MSLLSTILLFLAGLVGAAPFILRRFENLHDTIENLRKYSSMIGLYLLIVGLIKLLRLVGGREVNIHDIAIIVAMVGLGFLQGFEFIMQLFRNNVNLMNKSEKIRTTLYKYQESLGLLAIVVSVLHLFRII
jgi:hypothetical protein